jgi:hypothetical protein
VSEEKKNEETMSAQEDILVKEMIDNQPNLQEIQEKWQMVELKTNILSMSKEILERNAALKWEQNKTRGLNVSHEEIIDVARDILDFILE